LTIKLTQNVAPSLCFGILLGPKPQHRTSWLGKWS